MRALWGWLVVVPSFSSGFFGLGALAPALGQPGLQPPPRQDTVSATGVSLQSGAFVHQERDLAIGGSDFPRGLTLDRSYSSGLASVFSQFSGYQTQGWTSNLNVRVGNWIVPTPWQQPPPGMEHYLYSVSIGHTLAVA